MMLRLADDLDVSYLDITHDLAAARYLCRRIAVMYLGKIVEIAPTETLLSDPKHLSTRALLSAEPVPDPTVSRPEVDIRRWGVETGQPCPDLQIPRSVSVGGRLLRGERTSLWNGSARITTPPATTPSDRRPRSP
jgi:ABC-type antimicrobial peptide transport system ATPase subunit